MKDSTETINFTKFLCSIISISNCSIMDKDVILSKLSLMKNLDWDKLIEQARNNNCVPVVFSTIRDYKSSINIPNQIYEELQKTYLKASATYLKRVKQVKDIIDKLNKENIEFIFLKGVIYAEYLYKNPATRTMSDIDILVKKSDIAKCFKIFLEMGYSNPYKKIKGRNVEIISKYHLPAFDCEGKFSIELHTHLNLESKAINYKNLDPNLLLEKQTETFFLYGKPCLKLKDEYLFVYSSISLASQLFRQKILRFHDLAILVKDKKVDINKIMDIAELLDAKKIVKTVLFILREYFYCSGISEDITSDILICENLRESMEKFIFGDIFQKEIDNVVYIDEVISKSGICNIVAFLISKFFRYEDIFLVYGFFSIKTFFYLTLRTYLGFLRLIKCGNCFILNTNVLTSKKVLKDDSLFGKWLRDL